jgi:hypothetical protein
MLEVPTDATRDETVGNSNRRRKFQHPLSESNFLDSDPNSSDLVGNLKITSWEGFLLGEDYPPLYILEDHGRLR